MIDERTERTLAGLAASGGLGMAPTVVITGATVEIVEDGEPKARFATAADEVAAALRALADEVGEDRGEAGEVLKAQAMMAEDPELADRVEERLDAGETLDAALAGGAGELRDMLASMDDEYLAARAADVEEVEARIRRHLAGVAERSIELTEPSVVLAHALTTADTVQLDPELIRGFATETGGPTSHVAIIARSLGVPAVVGVSGLMSEATDGAVSVIDGTNGTVVLDPADATAAEIDERLAADAARRRAEAELRGVEVVFDGMALDITANAAGADDIARAAAAGADGIGLFRTEFLFLDRAEAPTEDEQYALYRSAGEDVAAGTPDRSRRSQVIIRTYDIGGDKPADFLELPEEENPFLGVRGVRLYPETRDLLETQLAAVARAAATADLAVMVPMVAGPEDLVLVREVLAEQTERLVAAGHEVGEVEIGAMVEVPAAAVMAGALAEHAAFLSIGTNDLTQYTMAADRGEARLAHLQDPVHPALLRLCKMTVDGAATHGVPVGVCGLAAADPTAALLFAGLGISKLSVAAASVNTIKSIVSAADPAEVRAVATAALDAADAEAVRALVAPLLANTGA